MLKMVPKLEFFTELVAIRSPALEVLFRITNLCLKMVTRGSFAVSGCVPALGSN